MRNHRFTRLLTIVCVIVAVVAGTARPVAAEAGLSLPGSATPGSTITLGGSGWVGDPTGVTSGPAIDIYVDGALVGTARPGPDGTFTTSVAIPATATGQVTIAALQSDVGLAAERLLTIDPPAIAAPTSTIPPPSTEAPATTVVAETTTTAPATTAVPAAPAPAPPTTSAATTSAAPAAPAPTTPAATVPAPAPSPAAPAPAAVPVATVPEAAPAAPPTPPAPTVTTPATSSPIDDEAPPASTPIAGDRPSISAPNDAVPPIAQQAPTTTIDLLDGDDLDSIPVAPARRPSGNGPLAGVALGVAGLGAAIGGAVRRGSSKRRSGCGHEFGATGRRVVDVGDDPAYFDRPSREPFDAAITALRKIERTVGELADSPDLDELFRRLERDQPTTAKMLREFIKTTRKGARRRVRSRERLVKHGTHSKKAKRLLRQLDDALRELKQADFKKIDPATKVPALTPDEKATFRLTGLTEADLASKPTAFFRFTDTITSRVNRLPQRVTASLIVKTSAGVYPVTTWKRDGMGEVADGKGGIDRGPRRVAELHVPVPSDGKFEVLWTAAGNYGGLSMVGSFTCPVGETTCVALHDWVLRGAFEQQMVSKADSIDRQWQDWINEVDFMVGVLTNVAGGVNALIDMAGSAGDAAAPTGLFKSPIEIIENVVQMVSSFGGWVWSIAKRVSQQRETAAYKKNKATAELFPEAADVGGASERLAN